MAGEPGYIKELKQQVKGITQTVAETKGTIIKIETTLTDTLPDIKTGLAALNGTVRKHETEIALQKQAYEECPARKSYGATPGNPGVATGQWVIDLSQTKGKVIAGGGLVGIPSLILIVLELARVAAQHFWGG